MASLGRGLQQEIYLRFCLVGWHIVIFGADLGQHRLRDDRIVCFVSGIKPIFYHLSKHGAGQPPIIRLRQKPLCHSRLIAFVP